MREQEESAAQTKQTAEDRLVMKELQVTKERPQRSEELQAAKKGLMQSDAEMRQLEETHLVSEARAVPRTVPKTPPMASPVKARNPTVREAFDELMSVLPKDLKTDEVEILRARVGEAVSIGFVLNNSMKRELTHTDPGDRFQKAVKILDSQMADEYEEENGLLDTEESRDRWVHDKDEEKADERWVLDEDHEEDRTSVEGPDMSSEEALEHFELHPDPDPSTPKMSAGPTDGAGSCVACYYPMIGVFDTKKQMERSIKTTQRPGEMTKPECQTFDNFDRAMGALQGKYPDLTLGDLNDFQMAKERTTPSTWAIQDGALRLGGLILVILIVGAVLPSGDQPSGLPIGNSMEAPEVPSSYQRWAQTYG
jgi:hypothetical protein